MTKNVLNSVCDPVFFLAKFEDFGKFGLLQISPKGFSGISKTI